MVDMGMVALLYKLHDTTLEGQKRHEGGQQCHEAVQRAHAPADRYITDFGHPNCQNVVKMGSRPVVPHDALLELQESEHNCDALLNPQPPHGGLVRVGRP